MHDAYRGAYGNPRVTVALRAQGQQIGRNRVARLMKDAGRQDRQARRYRARTTDSAHPHSFAPNLLAARRPLRPGQTKCGPRIQTYAETGEGWLHVAGVPDLYSRRLIGRAMGSSLATALPLAALQTALRRRRPGAGLLHHSDRGCQYARADYRSMLAEHGCIASMSRRGNRCDNATVEAFWSTLKHKLIYRRRFATRDEATTAIFDYIESFYNRTRLHSALGFKSPLAHESNLN